MKPRIFFGFSCGGTSDNQALRTIGWPELLPGGLGVADFIRKRVAPVEQCGATNIALWNPWGQTIKSGAAFMPASQLLLAKQIPELSGAVTGWLEAWAPLVQQMDETICYCGGITEDKTFSNLSAVNMMRRLRESFGLLWQADMSQGFDGDVLAMNGSRAAEAILMIAQTRPVYVEALWTAENDWCWDLPCIVRDDTYHQQVGQPWIRPKTDDWPEVIRILVPPAGESSDDLDSIRRWAPKAVARILKDGHSVIVNGHPFADAAWAGHPVSSDFLGIPV